MITTLKTMVGNEIGSMRGRWDEPQKYYVFKQETLKGNARTLSRTGQLPMIITKGEVSLYK